MFRRLIISHWTAIAAGAFLAVLHAAWLCRNDHQSDVISGFGVSIAVLGILVAAQPVIQGVKGTARQQVELHSEGIEKSALEQAADQAVRFVLKERVFGVGLIAVGTLLNGYAGALARLLSLKI